MALAAGTFEAAFRTGEAKPTAPKEIDRRAADARKAIERIDAFIVSISNEMLSALENPRKRDDHGKTAGMLRIAAISQRGSDGSYDVAFPENRIRDLPAYEPVRLNDPRVALPAPLLQLLERVQKETGRGVKLYLEVDASGNWSTNDELWVYLDKK